MRWQTNDLRNFGARLSGKSPSLNSERARDGKLTADQAADQEAATMAYGGQLPTMAAPRQEMTVRTPQDG